MYKLVLKDILIQKKMVIISILYGAFFILVFNKNLGDDAAIISGTSVVSYFFIINACAYEDKYNGFIIFTSLPIRKRDIVISKYLSILVFALIGMFFMTFIQLLLTSFGVGGRFELMSIETAAGSIIGCCILGAIYYPLYFKIGYMKSKYVVFILFMVIGFLPGILMSLVDKETAYEMIEFIVNKFNSIPDFVVGGVILGVVLIVLFISMIISIKIFVKKDL